MRPPTIVHSNEVSNLIANYPKGIRLSQLAEKVAKQFGASSKFQTGSLYGMDIDDLLAFLEARDKVRIVNGVIYPCSAAVYAH
jgi:probable metal-binding protein